MADPFLKWAGGKAELADRIIEIIGTQKISRYYEPFVGGGAVFFRLADKGLIKRATLSDSLGPLMNAYRCVKNSGARVARIANSIPGDEDTYYEVRARASRGAAESIEAAAEFIYLNKRGFNGLCRYNRSGGFNVPFGSKKRDGFLPAPEHLIALCQEALKMADLLAIGFEQALLRPRRGDLVYCDPPYIPRSQTSDFTSYDADGFADEHQVRLRDHALRLAKKGVRVILSNADVPRARELYKGPEFLVRKVEARRSINSKGNRRAPVGELVIVTRS